MREDFENFNDEDEEWLSELEISDTDLENELSDWHAAQARELAETSYGQDEIPRRGRPGMLRGSAQARPVQGRQHPGKPPSRPAPRPAGTVPARTAGSRHLIEEDPDDDFTTPIRTGGWPASGHPRGGPDPGHHRPWPSQRQPGSQAAVAQDHVRRGGRRRGGHGGVRADLQVEPVLAGQRGDRPEPDHHRLPEPQRGVRARPGQLRLRQDDEPDPVGVRPDDQRQQPELHRLQDRQAGPGADLADPGRRDRLVAEPAPPVQPGRTRWTASRWRPGPSTTSSAGPP